MPYCPECKKEINKKWKICPNCGTPNPLYQEAKIDKPDAPTDQNINKTVKRGENFYGKINLEDLPKGYIIDDRYDVKEKLGQGGFGAVYQAYDKDMNIEKALKIIPNAIINDKEAMYDLQKEAQTMISLNHPNIVRVYDFHRRGKIKYIDMEYIVGKTLTEIKLEHANKRISVEEVKEYAIKISEGLAYAHSKNVIHKDIKPQNVMITKDNEVKLMDFGIAETVRTSMSRIQNTSSSGTLVYMSPEQLLGENVGKESDIYSFGAMLYELLSGHPPFYKGAIEHQVLNKKPKPLDFISDSLNQLIMKCLQKSYEDRYHDFSEIIKFLEKSSIHIKKNKENNNDKVDPETMILVEGGTFQMGSKGVRKDEQPVHAVKLSSFYISKYLVTQREWKKVMGKNPSRFKGDNRPVENVSWYDVVEFCNKKSKADGLEKCYSGRGDKIQCDFSKTGYRLPTEAEWEYAARGGKRSKGYKYSGSNNIDEVGWYYRNNGRVFLFFGGTTNMVGIKKRNELGIYDMSGNVWEWCWDWFDEDYYSKSSKKNPKGPEGGKRRVLRGGSYYSYSNSCQVDNRVSINPDGSNDDYGFRFVKSVE